MASKVSVVNVAPADFRRMVKALERSAEQTERLTLQIDQLLAINHQLLDMMVAAELDEQEAGFKFLDGSDE